jgi:hypothetical protein
MDTIFRRALIVCAILFVLPAAAAACRCVPGIAVDKQYDDAKVVGIFKLISWDIRPNTGTYTQPAIYTPLFRVERVYKGDIRTGQTIRFELNASACSYPLDRGSVGEDFLLFLKPDRPNGENVWAISACSGSKPKIKAAAELLYLEKVAQVNGKTLLYGTARRLDTVVDSGKKQDREEPLAHLAVTVSGNGKTYNLKTDQNGVYEIYGLPPGEYRITPEAIDGWIAELDLKFGPAAPTIRAKSGTVQNISYYPDSSIKGRVVDPSGKAVANVRVRLIAASGESLPDFTDDDIKNNIDGKFEFSRIPRGKYLIEVAPFDRKSPVRPFDTFYYLNADKREDARPIDIKPGQHIKDLDLTVPKMAEVVTFTGMLLYNDGKPVAGGTVGFFRDGESFDLKHPEEKTTTDSEGRFTLRVLKGQPGTLTGLVEYTTQRASPCPDLLRALRKVRLLNPEMPQTIPSESVGIETTDGVSAIELRFPFGSCPVKR